MVKKAKRYNAELEEFEKFKFNRDLITLEKYRYLCAQLLMAKWKMQKLKEALMAGTTYSSTEAEAKIKEMEKRFTLLSSRITLIKETINEMAKKSGELKKGTLSEGILENYVAIRKNMIKIEKTYGRMANIRAPELFTKLTSEVEELRERIRFLEDAFGETEDMMLSAKLEKTREFLDEYEKLMGPDKTKEVIRNEI